ncbi:MAG TPA: hypothetical protein VHO90_01245 [Bacteroidales bacterium]|nr:hypothetical protein [Bacteroidales bacterium]
MYLRKLELEDQAWVPAPIKDGMTDYLRFLFHTFDLYRPVVPILNEVLAKSNSCQIVDLCSGSGGAIRRIQHHLEVIYSRRVQIVLTDLFPRIDAYSYLSGTTQQRISFESSPVDAANVPERLKGVRTMFSGIHHFDPLSARRVIANAVNARQPIAFFDGGNKNFFMILLILLIHPVAVMLSTPFIRPFRWSRLFYTYVFPFIIIGAVWDGIISIINLYRPSTLLNIAQNVDNTHYLWKAGKVRNNIGLSILYLTGIPTLPKV